MRNYDSVNFMSKDKPGFQMMCVMIIGLPNRTLLMFFCRKLQDFMEDEAELSGSDVGSEDEYDGEDQDEYEEEIIDEELPNEVELGNQVQKLHLSVTVLGYIFACGVMALGSRLD